MPETKDKPRGYHEQIQTMLSVVLVKEKSSIIPSATAKSSTAEADEPPTVDLPFFQRQDESKLEPPSQEIRVKK
jgi:hypothetical protein